MVLVGSIQNLTRGTVQVGELATERVLKIAKAAEAAKRLGQEAARAAGELELGAGDGIGACSRTHPLPGTVRFSP
eukprot:COSAG02_NODE_35166_length_472_cov_1.927614_2_plen_75_part_00